MSEYKNHNRDVSWLSFNYRVLLEAKDKSLPLYERIKFLAIYSNNLDEFYKVRVASYRSLLDLPKNSIDKLKEDPAKVLEKMQTEISRQQAEFGEIFRENIIPELEANNITLYQSEKNLPQEHVDYTEQYFFQEVLPQIQPILLSKGNILSFLQDNTLYLAIKLYKKKKKETPEKEEKYKKKKGKYAIIKVPKEPLGRFVSLPQIGDMRYIMFIEDIIRLHMDALFPGFEIAMSYSIKLSRNADLLIEDEFSGNLVEKIRKGLHNRQTGMPARFLYDVDIPKKFLKLLRQVFNISKDDLVEGGRYHSFSDFFGFPNPEGAKLEIDPWPPLHHTELDSFESITKAMRVKDRVLHFPYHSYEYVIRFLSAAALHPKVDEIMATQYRVATNSAVVSALISAARNGKKVTVFVEVKARFDEATNIESVDRMKAAGINVITSIPEIKVHAKFALVLRKPDVNGNRKGYAFLSTGNFNEKTAKIYADHGLFTCNVHIINEIKAVFKYLKDQTFKYEFKHLLVARFNLRQQIRKYIDREIQNKKSGKKAYILLKMNGLDDPKTISKLYDASLAGVKIDLIIRGVCSLVCGQPYSRNITITRIVDRYLEHARVFVFYNDGKYDTYISSADIMRRNLYRRVESTVPIYNKEVKQELIDILKIQLKGNTKACILDENLNNIRKTAKEGREPVHAQHAIYEYVKDMNQKYSDKTDHE